MSAYAYPEIICDSADPKWPQYRQEGITETDITAIIGLSPYESPYSLYTRKRGVLPPLKPTPRMRLGSFLEAYAYALWSEGPDSEGLLPRDHRNWLVRSGNRPWQLATPDRIMVREDPDLGLFAGPLELKTWNDAWDDGIPPVVRAKLLWQMDVLDTSRGWAGVLFLPSGEFRSFSLAHDRETVPCRVCEDQELMRQAAEDFLRRLRDSDPPDPDASAATLAALKWAYPPAAQETAEVDSDLWEHWCGLKVMARAVERDLREAEARIREQAGTAGILTVGGEQVGRHLRYQIAEKNIREPYWQDYIVASPARRSEDEADNGSGTDGEA